MIDIQVHEISDFKTLRQQSLPFNNLKFLDSFHVIFVVSFVETVSYEFVNKSHQLFARFVIFTIKRVPAERTLSVAEGSLIEAVEAEKMSTGEKDRTD